MRKLLLALAACTSTPTVKDAGTPVALPKLTSAVTTEARTIVPSRARTVDPRDPRDPAARAAQLAEGFGDFTFGPGEPHVTLTPPSMTPPARGPDPKLLVRFAHLADAQLADDESPSRLARFDDRDLLNATFRPHEHDQCRVINAAVRTLNALHAQAPISFLLLGGDNLDNAQENELGWLLGILGGAGRVDCDSGRDDPGGTRSGGASSRARAGPRRPTRSTSDRSAS